MLHQGSHPLPIYEDDELIMVLYLREANEVMKKLSDVSNIENVFPHVADLFNVHMITQFINNNMTTLSSAMRNVWEFTLDNIGLILYFLETLISVVLVSGSTVFSFIIDIVSEKFQIVILLLTLRTYPRGYCKYET